MLLTLLLLLLLVCGLLFVQEFRQMHVGVPKFLHSFPERRVEDSGRTFLKESEMEA